MTDTTTTPTGDRDVTEILTDDHSEMLALIGEIRLASDPERRRDLTDTVISEVVRHAVAEEMYVYPAMKKHLPDGEEAVQHDIEEHKELEELMKALEDVDTSEPRFLQLLGEFEAALKHHADDEETEQFPTLRARIPRDELVEIGAKVQTAKKVAPTRPHPNAPNNELFHKLVGPGVGLVDRLRDKLTNRSN